MRGVVFHGPGDVRAEDLGTSPLGPRDALLAVEACGICGSDLSSYAHGHYVEPGQVMGHEIAARVVETGPDLAAELRPGALVAVRPMRSCGECAYCRAGDTHLCGATYGPSLGYGTPGGFAERLVMADVVVGQDLVPVPDHVDPLDLLWAEPLAVAVHAVELAGAGASRILVTGAGAVGLAVTAAALAVGAAVDVVEPLAERRAAAQGLGAGAFAPDALPAGAAYDALVDASGVPAAVHAALDRLRPGAPVVLVGLGDRPVPWPLGDHRLVGAFAYRQQDFTRAVDLLARGEVSLRSLVTHRYGLEDATRALVPPGPEDGVVKVALVPGLTHP